MNEKYLPVGTVVTLNGATKKVMILGYFPMSEDNKVYDYNACTYPEGVLDADRTLAFNHDKIKEVNHMGLVDDEYRNYNEQLKSMLEGIQKIQKVELPKENVQPVNNQNINPVPNENTSINNAETSSGQPEIFNFNQ